MQMLLSRSFSGVRQAPADEDTRPQVVVDRQPSIESGTSVATDAQGDGKARGARAWLSRMSGGSKHDSPRASFTSNGSDAVTAAPAAGAAPSGASHGFNGGQLVGGSNSKATPAEEDAKHDAAAGEARVEPDADKFDDVIGELQQGSGGGQQGSGGKSKHWARCFIKRFGVGPLRVYWAPLVLSAALLVVAIALLIWVPEVDAWSFLVWKLFLYFALLYPLKLACDLTVAGVILGLESAFWKVQVVMFFIMNIRHALTWQLWTITWLVMYIVLFSTHQNSNPGNAIYAILLRLLVCVVLFLLAHCLSKVIEKVLAWTFHEETYFTRMQQALRQEYYIVSMMQPRERRTKYRSRRSSAAAMHVGAQGSKQKLTDWVSEMYGESKPKPKPMRASASAICLSPSAGPARADGGSSGPLTINVLQRSASAPGAVSPPRPSSLFAVEEVDVLAGGYEDEDGYDVSGDAATGADGRANGSAVQDASVSARDAGVGPQDARPSPVDISPLPPRCPDAAAVEGVPASPAAERVTAVRRSVSGASCASGRSLGGGGGGGGGRSPRGGGGGGGSGGLSATASRGVQWVKNLRPSLGSGKGGSECDAGSHASVGTVSRCSGGGSAAVHRRSAEEGSRDPCGAPSSPPKPSAPSPKRKSIDRQASRLATVQELHEAIRGHVGATASDTSDSSADNSPTAASAEAQKNDPSSGGGGGGHFIATRPRPVAGPGTNNVQLLQAIHQMEKHLRKSRMAMPVTDLLNRRALPGGVSSNSLNRDSGHSALTGSGKGSAAKGSAGGGGKDERGGGNAATEAEARRLSFFLFFHVKAEADLEREYLIQEDLEPFLPRKDAARAFALFDKEGKGKVSLVELCEAVTRMLQEREALSAALRGSKTIVAQVARVMAVVINVIFVFVYIMVWGYSLNESWVAISGIILGFSFIFASYLSNIFTCTMWLLTVRPFEVGDAIKIGGVYHTVESVRLQHTQLRTSEGELIWYPNGQMVTEPVLNMSNSSEKWESFRFLVDLQAPIQAVLDEARARLPAWFGKRTDEFTGSFNIVMSGIKDPMKAEILFIYQLTHSGVELRRTHLARSQVYSFLGGLLLELCAGYSLPPIAVSDVRQQHHHSAHHHQQQQPHAGGGGMGGRGNGVLSTSAAGGAAAAAAGVAPGSQRAIGLEEGVVFD